MTQAFRLKNNFDFLRVFAALCIAFTHSFGLLGLHAEEWLVKNTKDNLDFSFVGLSIFFTISGYLITKSAATSPSILNFAWKRVLRIQPILILTCLLSVFILGPLFTSLPASYYFSEFETWTYFRNIMPVFGVQFYLPGVFGSLHDGGVNGSLWTLIVEERLYLIVVIFFLFKMKNRFSYIVFVLLLNVVFFIHNIILNDSFILYLNQAHIIYVLMFLNAGLSYELNFSFKSKPLQFFAAGLMVTSLLIFFKFPIFFWVWTIPLCILGFAYLRIALNKTGRFGDFTYGIYIFTFPVQQMIVSKYGATISPLQLFVCSVLFCLPLAILSWHLLEKKCLQLKERVV